MSGVRPVVVAAVGAIVTVAAMVLPWARYGGIEVRLHELPGWFFYLAAAVAQQLCVAACLVTSISRRRVRALAAGLAVGAVAVVAATVLMVTSQDPTAVFGPVVPLVAPAVDSGGPVALAGVVIGATATILAVRDRPAALRGLRHRSGGGRPPG